MAVYVALRADHAGSTADKDLPHCQFSPVSPYPTIIIILNLKRLPKPYLHSLAISVETCTIHLHTVLFATTKLTHATWHGLSLSTSVSFYRDIRHAPNPGVGERHRGIIARDVAAAAAAAFLNGNFVIESTNWEWF